VYMYMCVCFFQGSISDFNNYKKVQTLYMRPQCALHKGESNLFSHFILILSCRSKYINYINVKNLALHTVFLSVMSYKAMNVKVINWKDVGKRNICYLSYDP
jgi:hypothetical protein